VKEGGRGPPRGEEELEQYADILADSLNFPQAPRDRRAGGAAPRAVEERLGRYLPSDLRLVRAHGRVVGGLVLLPAGQFFGGQPIPMVGIHAVAIAPESRGTRLGRELLTGVVQELGEAGGPLIACLYPATQPLYRSVGFEQAGTFTRYRIPVAKIPVGPHDLAIERLSADPDIAGARLGSLYRTVAARQNGWVDRTPWFWRRVVDPMGTRRDTYAVVDGGQVTGYVSLAREWRQDGHPHMEIEFRELVAADAAALRRLWTFLADERSLGQTVVVPGAPAPADHLLFLEQAPVVGWQIRWMLRVLDVERALGARGYPDQLAREISFEVSDDLLEKNRGRFTLAVGGGRGQVRRGGGGPAVRLDVRGLAALYGGYLPAEELARAGMAEGPDAALAAASAAFAGPSPWLPEIF
jgi:predicted acetyltransferase